MSVDLAVKAQRGREQTAGLLTLDGSGEGRCPAQVVVDDLSLLFSYLDDAYALAITYLRSLTPESLDDIVDESWDPPVTRAVRLASVIDDAAQHSGQAVYTRRLLGLPG